MPREFSWKTAALLCLGVGLLTTFLSIALQVGAIEESSSPQIIYAIASPVGGEEDFVNTSIVKEGGVLAQGIDNTFRLQILTIGVDALIQSVGLTREGALDTPSNFKDVAWYNLGPFPGSLGNAVISGHLDGRNIPRAVFYDLQKLRPGDLIDIVKTNGEKVSFQVAQTKIYKYDDSMAEIFSNDLSVSRLNLITCAGSWLREKKTYNQRTVVTAELIN